jgi:hypothetical protein
MKRLKTENIEKCKTMSQHLPPQKQVWREIPFHGQLRINFCETHSEKSEKQTLRNRILKNACHRHRRPIPVSRQKGNSEIIKITKPIDCVIEEISAS